tara:strand:- start:2345 stop:2557 length:213 start_codon:yes stop_codon:yes gene_type:complete
MDSAKPSTKYGAFCFMKIVFGGGHEISYQTPECNPDEMHEIEKQIVRSYTAIHVMMNTGVLCQIYMWGET